MRLSSILRGAPRKSDVSDLRTLNLPISETSEIGGAHLRMRGDVHFVMPALLSSLPDLIRQSMRKRRISSVRFHIRRFSMDHRVKPGGDEVRVRYFFSIDMPLGPRSMRTPSGCLRS